MSSVSGTIPLPRPSEASGAPGLPKPPVVRQARLELVERYLFERRRTGAILLRLRDEGHVVSGSQLRADIRAIRARWARESSASVTELRREVVETHRNLRSRALREGNLPVARQANRDLARWSGLEVAIVVVPPESAVLNLEPYRQAALDPATRAAATLLLERLLPAPPGDTKVEAKVVRTEPTKNGNGNGHYKNGAKHGNA